MDDAYADHLIIKVHAGINLIAKDVTGTSDSYVVYQLEDIKGHKDKKKKSQVITSLNPVWNWECEAIPMFRIKDYHKLHFQVYDQDFGSKDDFMGEATLLIADLIVKAESISIGKKKAHEGLLHLPLQPKFVPGAKKGKSNKVTGQLVIHYTFPPIKHVREASEKSLLSLKTITGRDVFKVSASGSVGVQTFYELPPFLYDSSGFSINNAMWFANLCQLAYKKPDVILTTGPALFKMEECQFFEDEELDAQGYGMYNDKATFICFRGTESATDGLINITFFPIMIFVQERTNKETFLAPKRPAFDDYPQILVHTGFYCAFESLLEQVEKFIEKSYEKYPNNQLYLSGHSLGGALAQVCLLHYLFGPVDKRRKVHKVYTIGQPVVCSSEGRKLLETLYGDVEYFRITNRLDFIPSLGLGTHCGEHVHIGSDGKIDFRKESISTLSSLKRGSTMIAKGVGGCMTDHSSASYFKWIEKNWIKYEVCKMSSVSSEYNILNSLLYLVDKLSEELKLVRKHKNFLRNLMEELKEVRFIVNGIMDHITDISPKILKIADLYLSNLSNLLYKIHSYISKHSKIQNFTSRKFSSRKLNTIGEQLKQVCNELKHLVLILHSLKPDNLTLDDKKNTMAESLSGFYSNLPTSDSCNPSNPDYQYQPSSRVASRTESGEKGLSEHATKIETFNEFYRSNQFAEAISFFKDNLYTENDPDFIEHLLILAQCSIEIADFPATFFYLGEIVNRQSSIIEEEVFSNPLFDKLRANPMHGAALETVIASINARNTELSRYKEILTENEIQSLTEFFYEADVNGDTLLSYEEVTTFVENFGVKYVLESLGWSVPRDLDQRWEKYQSIVQTLKVVSIDQFLNSFATLKSTSQAK